MNVVGMYVQDFDAGHGRFLHSPVDPILAIFNDKFCHSLTHLSGHTLKNRRGSVISSLKAAVPQYFSA